MKKHLTLLLKQWENRASAYYKYLLNEEQNYSHASRKFLQNQSDLIMYSQDLFVSCEFYDTNLPKNQFCEDCSHYSQRLLSVNLQNCWNFDEIDRIKYCQENH